MSSVRTFIAIELPESVRRGIAKVQDELRKQNERISWTKPGNIHLTLKFLGDVEESRIPMIAAAIEKIGDEAGPFTLRVKDLGAFPKLARPRVIWVGIEEPKPGVTEIAHKIDAALSNLGFPKEKRKFSPHLTIGRVKSQTGSKFLQKLKSCEFEGAEIKVEEMVVMKSDLRPTGAVYTALKRIKLGLREEN